MGSLSLLQGISQPRDQTQVSCIAGGLSLPAESQGKPKNTGVGSLSLLQGIFPTQGLNPGLPHCRRTLYQLSHQGSPDSLEPWLCGLCVESWDLSPRPLRRLHVSGPQLALWKVFCKGLASAHQVGSKTSAWRCGEPEQTACSVFLETYNLTFSKHFSCLSPDKLDVVIPIQNTLEKWQLPF